MLETKIVNKINKSKVLGEKIKNYKKDLLIQAEEWIKSFEELFAEVENAWEENKVLHFENENIIFYTELALVMDAGEAKKVGDFEELEIVCDKVKEELLTEAEARKIFFEYSSRDRIHNYRYIICFNEKNNSIGYIEKDNVFQSLIKNNYQCQAVNYSKIDFNSIFKKKNKSTIGAVIEKTTNPKSFRVPFCYHFDKSTMTKIQILLEFKEAPIEIEAKELFYNLLMLIENEYVVEHNGNIIITSKGIEAIEKGLCTKIGQYEIKKSKLYFDDSNDMELEIDKMSFDEKKFVLSYYSECDKIRSNINSYDISWLEDPNQGHWELWDGNESDETIRVSKNSKLYARNPVTDIKWDCIVGIDFGTKSTVVVCQNETGIIKPLPIGNGDIRKKLELRDYENPTVMQFVDLLSFINGYSKRDGRPYTEWKDLIISHAANESMQDSSIRSDEFYSYLYDLKQWAGEGKRAYNLRDKKGNDIFLDLYSKLNEIEKEEAFHMDPIEIYAYYIGLYINNMNNGIYFDYLLSFPVTYEKNIRNAILNSFKRGLKKSLPESILKDNDLMSRFNVTAGASEPAAYAICALEEYGFEPLEEEKVFYGIFDFGGGTSDFDFGLWTRAKDEELFDYTIEHFGTQGDRYLGGENLLQLLAFEVFSQNIDMCRNEGIPFAKPIEMINISSEVLGFVNDSQEARINQKLMMEKLRPFWERSNDLGEEIIDIKDFEEFQLGLFSVDGVLKSNLPLEVDIEKLNKILVKRIEKGVTQFFEALKDTFSIKHIHKTSMSEQVNVFLAGNSSKSIIFQRIFNNKISEWNEGVRSKQGENDKEYFVLYPPLGTEQAKRIQKERNIVLEDDFESPNGKTGVAWGLIKGREGGRIEVKEEIDFDEEAKFAFYLGTQKGKYFNPKIDRDEEYDKWIRILPARRRVNEILYTSLPEAMSGKLLCTENGVFRKRIEINFDLSEVDKSIYVRIVSVDSIEYAIGDEEGNIDKTSIKTEKL